MSMVSNAFTLLNRRINPWSYRVLNRETVLRMCVKRQHASSDAIVQPRFSSGEDENRLKAETHALLECKWTLNEDNTCVQKTFNFPTFAKALVTRSSGQPRRP